MLIGSTLSRARRGRPFAAVLVLLVGLLAACSDEFSVDEDSYRVGPHGEPPPALGLVYRKTFVVEQGNYVRALGEIHAFLIENSFFVRYREPCFGDVLDIKVTADRNRHKEAFPCALVLATRQSELTEIYLRVSVNEVNFNRIDRDNRLELAVHMFGKDALVPAFVAGVEPNLLRLRSHGGGHL